MKKPSLPHSNKWSEQIIQYSHALVSLFRFHTWIGSIKWNNVYKAFRIMPDIQKATNKWKLLIWAVFCIPLYIFHLSPGKPWLSVYIVVKMECSYTGCYHIPGTGLPQENGGPSAYKKRKSISSVFSEMTYVNQAQ